MITRSFFDVLCFICIGDKKSDVMVMENVMENVHDVDDPIG
jgi:hypothetical protein